VTRFFKVHGIQLAGPSARLDTSKVPFRLLGLSILDLSVCWTDRWHGLGCCAAIVLVLVLAPQGHSRGNQETRTLD
jgi:hypothetical protein